MRGEEDLKTEKHGLVHGNKVMKKGVLGVVHHFLCLWSPRLRQDFQQRSAGTEQLEVHPLCGLREPLWGGSREKCANSSGKQVVVTSYDDYVL